MDQGIGKSDHRVKIGIITVCYNAEEVIESTIHSVLNQSVQPFEFIVIDGDSKDHTLSLVSMHKDKISKIISEPDKGIYDAMNKGVAASRSDYILFMNAGDTFASNDVLERVTPAIDGETLVYGDHNVRYADHYVRFQKAKIQPELIWKGMICSHQSLFAARNRLIQKPFIADNSAADFDFIFNTIKEGHRSLYLGFPISTIEAGGLSDRKRFNSILERWAILRRHRVSLKSTAYYAFLIADNFIRWVIKSILPVSAIRSLIRLKYKTK